MHRHADKSSRKLALTAIVALVVGLWVGLSIPSGGQRPCSSHRQQPTTTTSLHDFTRRTNWALQLTKEAERRVSSQFGQDGILEFIFHHIGTTNKYYVEFGFDSDTYDGGGGANTALLHERYGWSGLLMDGVHANPAIDLHQELITPDNILSLLTKYHVPSEPDYLSIDIDSADIWVFREIVTSRTHRPRVISAEYNSNLPLHSTLAWPRSRPGTWDGKTRFYGAGLGAFRAAAAEGGYSIVWVVPHDVFFVRDDVLEGVSDVLPFERWRGATQIPLHHPVLPESAPFEEYHTWLQTGNSSAAAEAAREQMREMGVNLASADTRARWPRQR